jgi:hypothetical protein
MTHEGYKLRGANNQILLILLFDDSILAAGNSSRFEHHILKVED